MLSEKEWKQKAKGLIQAHMKLKGWDYEQLRLKLNEIGVEENDKQNIINKVNRGTFSAVFFLQCLGAMGVRELKVD